MAAESASGRDVRAEIRKYVIEELAFHGEPSRLDDTESFLESGIIDSRAFVDLVAFIEETYDITVEDVDMVPENLDSVDQLVAFIQRKTG